MSKESPCRMLQKRLIFFTNVKFPNLEGMMYLYAKGKATSSPAGSRLLEASMQQQLQLLQFACETALEKYLMKSHKYKNTASSGKG